ncbi:hypothetical protein POF50_029875 [Streptomyces sp. SL13]|jgi:hypothetical protein|uniref:Uncharacterized protein n=1 Tax=Streptantibioticus silvisoli TaxID=2705255 RepID=A0AA90HBJ7_9ACTN|nr:hypothetical protein [Streptantibioticus silvisoli]MDI5966443.1 hypothetical protein [Streptantibioticus silvisoli]MDI5973502.1 hypothetical protein [Streptantibioticus silvisoli]
MSEPWTIERIAEALGDHTLAQRFLGEINRTPAHELLTTFAKWERIARITLAAVERGRDLAPFAERGENPPGVWVDKTDQVLEVAERNRSHRVA